MLCYNPTAGHRCFSTFHSNIGGFATFQQKDRRGSFATISQQDTGSLLKSNTKKRAFCCNLNRKYSYFPTQMGKSIQSVQSVSKRISSVCFFVNKGTNNKLQIKENCLGFHFPFETAAFIYVYRYINIYAAVSKYKHTLYTKIGTNGKHQLHLFTANGKQKFVFLDRQTINGN